MRVSDSLQKAISIAAIITLTAIIAGGQDRAPASRPRITPRDDGRPIAVFDVFISIVNAANDYPEIAPGSAVRVRAPINRRAMAQLDRDSLPTELDGVSVTIGGHLAGIASLWEEGAMIVAPREGLAKGTAIVIVTTPAGQYRGLVRVRDVAPGIFRGWRDGSYRSWPMALYRIGDGAPGIVTDQPITPTRGERHTFIVVVATGLRRARKVEVLIDGQSVPLAGVTPFVLPGEEYVGFELPESLWGTDRLVKVVIVADGDNSNPVWLRLASSLAEARQ